MMMSNSLRTSDNSRYRVLSFKIYAMNMILMLILQQCDAEGCNWSFFSEYKLKRHKESHQGKKDFAVSRIYTSK